MNDDIDFNDFEDIYFSVLHEVDLYEENQDCNVLCTKSYKAAKRWLDGNKQCL